MVIITRGKFLIFYLSNDQELLFLNKIKLYFYIFSVKKIAEIDFYFHFILPSLETHETDLCPWCAS